MTRPKPTLAELAALGVHAPALVSSRLETRARILDSTDGATRVELLLRGTVERLLAAGTELDVEKIDALRAVLLEQFRADLAKVARPAVPWRRVLDDPNAGLLPS